MIRSIFSIALAVTSAASLAPALAQDLPAAKVASPVMVTVEREGAPLAVEAGTPLQSGDVIMLSNNSEIIVNNGIVTFGDVSCAMANGVSYTLDLGAGLAAKQAGATNVCTALLTETAAPSMAAQSVQTFSQTGAVDGTGNAPLIIGGIVVAAGGIAAAAGGGGGDDGPTSP